MSTGPKPGALALPALAGSCLGLLLGFLLGLSSTPVVGAAVAALLAAAGVYWTVAPKPAPPIAPAQPAMTDGARHAATACLCIACIAGVAGGLWMRARDVFAPTPREQVKEWVDAGFSPADAHAIVAARHAGVVKAGYSVQARAADAVRSTILFGDQTTQCRQLDPEDFPAAADLASAFQNAGGSWKKLANAVAPLSADTQRETLKVAWEIACR